ncbi:hypothetical protein MES5069_460025 [Mesorhizobium escarrei]|uniref:Secreted protein n=1 Tax=Mesorhizobium escarrei TaxID=666018 RepID=A0ABM9E7U5_9HYPH|nr:hypothetical protein MES5069_460025 [Mesorhizobium escarrei]
MPVSLTKRRTTISGLFGALSCSSAMGETPYAKLPYLALVPKRVTKKHRASHPSVFGSWQLRHGDVSPERSAGRLLGRQRLKRGRRSRN